MSKQTTRLMVLGVISYRQPAHGYRIQKTLEEWHSDRWVSIAPASIYQQLKSLAGAGLIEPVAASADARTVQFQTTPAGAEEFHRLLSVLLDDDEPQPLSLMPLLYFLPSVSRSELIDALGTRIERLERYVAGYERTLDALSGRGPEHVREMFELARHGYVADIAWCRELRERLDRGAYQLRGETEPVAAERTSAARS